MKNIFLHIGRHKTGTSSLQYFLARNSALLRDLNIIYPKSGRPGNQIAHHLLAHSIQKKDHVSLVKILDSLEKECVHYDSIIISSEAFQNITRPTLVRDFFIKYRLYVVCYFRESLSYKLSAYRQYVHAQSDFISFYSYAIKMKPDYYTFRDRWRNNCDKFIMRLFQRDSLNGLNIITDFFSTVFKIKLEKGVQKIHRNPSIGGNLLYYKLLRNKHSFKEENEYNLLASLATEKEEYRKPFYIEEKHQKELRDDKNNRFLIEQFGEIEQINFEQFKPLPVLDTLEKDFEFFNSNFDEKLSIDGEQLVITG